MGGTNSVFGFRKFDVTCHNGNNGMAMLCVWVDAGVPSDPDAKVIWRKGSKILKSTNYNDFTSTSDIITDLVPGKYSVETIIDDISTSKRDFTINNAQPLSVQIKTTCYPISNVGKGQAKAFVKNADKTVKYRWKNILNKKKVISKSNVLNAKTGVYNLTVTDGRGCQNSTVYFLKPKTIRHSRGKCNS